MDGSRWTVDYTVAFCIHLFVLAYSCILHECAHVWVALKLGDPTGKMEGRLTLKPAPHFDLLWTGILPLLTYLRGGYMIGGPKPAPVNPLNFREPRAGFMWTALAGPATNFLLATLGFLLWWGLYLVIPDFVHDRSYNGIFFLSVIYINLTLTALNLIPVPPLDGSRFLRFILGRASEYTLDMIERMSFLPVLIAFYFLGHYAIQPFYDGANVLMNEVFDSDYITQMRAYYDRNR